MLSGYRFEVYRDRSGEFRWRLISRGRKILADSGEGYKSKTTCMNAVSRACRVVTGGAVIHDIAKATR